MSWAWATAAKATLDASRANAVAMVAILYHAIGELPEGDPERVAGENHRAWLILKIAMIDAELLIVTPFA